ncbi:MAG: hypothetical protein AB4426_18900 [Xenococcaceae cyanobacterium]
MKTTNFLTSACRYCRHYKPEGRRGGMCQQLGVPVQASWKACVLAAPPFTSNWESLEEIVLLENSLSLNYSPDSPSTEASDSETVLKAKQPATV